MADKFSSSYVLKVNLNNMIGGHHASEHLLKAIAEKKVRILASRMSPKCDVAFIIITFVLLEVAELLLLEM